MGMSTGVGTLSLGRSMLLRSLKTSSRTRKRHLTKERFRFCKGLLSLIKKAVIAPLS